MGSINAFHGHGQKTRTTDGDYMRARHYKYMIGRFQTPDPVNGSISSPQSWNLYTYVQNNPIMFTDPWGLRKKTDSSNPSGTGGVISVVCTPTEYGEICVVTGKPADQPIGAPVTSGLDPFSAEYKNLQDFLDELDATPISERPIELSPNYKNPSVQIMYQITPKEKTGIADEYKECLKQYWQCLAEQMNPFTPSVSSGGAAISKGMEFYYQAEAYNYALKKGLIQPAKSSIYRGIIRTSKVWGAVGSIGTTLTLPVSICLIKEIICLSKQ